MRYSSLECCILIDSKSFGWRWAPSRRTTWFWNPSSEPGVASLTVPSISLEDFLLPVPTTLGSGVRGPGPPKRNNFAWGHSDHYNKSAAVQTLCFQKPRDKKKRRIIFADQLTLITSLRQGCFYTMKAGRNMCEQFLVLLPTVTLN